MVYRLADLAARVGGKLIGDPDQEITGLAPLHAARSGEISFLANSRYRKFLESTSASAVVVGEDDVDACRTNAIVAKDPYLVFARLAALFERRPESAPGIHPSAAVADTAVVAADATIGAHAVIGANVQIQTGVVVGPGCVVEADVTIGAATRLVANVTLCYGVRLGSRVLVHPGAVIGSDGFGLANEHGRWVKIPQLGSVVIGDDVEIGANTTIDRGALGDTIIEEGVKLDNQIQVAHNVVIGEHTAIAGCVGIAGSAKIGKRCMIGGGVGISGHLEICDDVHVTGMTMVTKSITKAGMYSSGMPATDRRDWQKNTVRFRRLDEVFQRLDELERRLAEGPPLDPSS